MKSLLGPKEYWDRANAKRQVINNFYFGSGFGFFTFTCFYGYSLDLIPVTVDPFKVPILTKNLAKSSSVKGQLISKCPYEITVSSKIPMKLFLDFCPEIFCTFLGASWKLLGLPVGFLIYNITY